jgi:hypothetical protein
LLSNQCPINCQYVPSNTNVVTILAGRTILSVLVLIAALLYLIGYAVKLFTFNVLLAIVLVVDGKICTTCHSFSSFIHGMLTSFCVVAAAVVDFQKL